jgi:hypothetical protein
MLKKVQVEEKFFRGKLEISGMGKNNRNFKYLNLYNRLILSF